ncbi:MAG: histidinol-phosphatase HisJ family protein [Bacteroidia bacterium]|nr:histidinol-phosphatase HisJ family protein [Bacteroidia bacterium]
MNIDYHMHTNLSDGHNTHEEMILAALEKGFDEIGFSDHFNIKQPCKWAIGADEIIQLERKIFEMREEFGHRISILFGLEVDYFNDREDDIRKSLQQFNFDYVIGSIHFLGDWNYDTDKSRYVEFSNDFLYEWYFRELQKAAKSGLFDIMGHPDLIKKFRIWPETSQNQLFEETARIFAESGVAFEINTSGKDRPCGEFFPGNELLKALCNAGVPVTLGSDSHNKEQIGCHFDEARTILTEIGYTKITRFRNRKRIAVTI